MTLTHVTRDPTLGKLDFWRKIWLNHFLYKLLTQPSPRNDYTTYELECLQSEPIRHSISKMYSLLTLLAQTTRPCNWEKWEKDLDISISPTDRNRILKLMHKSSCSALAQESNYKIVSRWFRNPQILHKMFPNQPARCWRCGAEDGGLLHILWECGAIQPFWSTIQTHISSILSLSVPDDPAFCQLQHQLLLTYLPKHNILPLLLLAAKCCVTAKWKQNSPLRSTNG